MTPDATQGERLSDVEYIGLSAGVLGGSISPVDNNVIETNADPSMPLLTTLRGNIVPEPDVELFSNHLRDELLEFLPRERLLTL